MVVLYCVQTGGILVLARGQGPVLSLSIGHNCCRWIQTAQNSISGQRHTLFVLVGAKCDLDAHRAVSADDVGELCAHFNIKHYVETSAKEDFRVMECFTEMAELALAQEYVHFSGCHQRDILKLILVLCCFSAMRVHNSGIETTCHAFVQIREILYGNFDVSTAV